MAEGKVPLLVSPGFPNRLDQHLEALDPHLPCPVNPAESDLMLALILVRIPKHEDIRPRGVWLHSGYLHHVDI
eukprot:CAMPEP_0115311242 /NCGR_PEP_ID=MMETSP0270-20121206/75227_1 /TAXON_ID=71861 /ORGANISM="Scrippsiella trochoidea, Strain CCMP3099" /LENGTH=72 /DNA_ID=CAMNT_0002730053 /DNA_START=12 /DNA_END=230 /DNA_ORIENTATION=+